MLELKETPPRPSPARLVSFCFGMYFEIKFEAWRFDAQLICLDIEDTLRQVLMLLFGGHEPYDEEGGQLMIELEDWLEAAAPGDVYRDKFNDLTITAKNY